MSQDHIILGSICYIVYEGEVLLLKRANPPHQGLWSPPGGKMEFGESPSDCCIREIQEETGITIVAPELRAMQTVVDIAIPIHWQLFIYRATLTQKVLPQQHPDHHEGELYWFNIDELDVIQRAYTDRQHWTHVIGENPNLWQGKFIYDTPDKLIGEQLF